MFLLLIIGANIALLFVPLEGYTAIAIFCSTGVISLFWGVSAMPSNRSKVVIIGTTFGMEFRRTLRKNRTACWSWFLLTGICVIIGSVSLAITMGRLIHEGLSSVGNVAFAIVFLGGGFYFGIQLLKSVLKVTEMENMIDPPFSVAQL